MLGWKIITCIPGCRHLYKATWRRLFRSVNRRQVMPSAGFVSNPSRRFKIFYPAARFAFPTIRGTLGQIFYREPAVNSFSGDSIYPVASRKTNSPHPPPHLDDKSYKRLSGHSSKPTWFATCQRGDGTLSESRRPMLPGSNLRYSLRQALRLRPQLPQWIVALYPLSPLL